MSRASEDLPWRRRRRRKRIVDLTALSQLELRDAAGAPRRLGDLWAQQPILLVFLRHFG
jgi:hypothetical protein